MGVKLLNHIIKMNLFVLLIHNFSVFSQCVDGSIRPADNFILNTYSPRCNGGNDGELRFLNIFSTAGINDYTNQQYYIRILNGPTGTSTHAVPLNTPDYVITGLVAGVYTVDIIDQCGGNSADKTVTLFQTQPNIPSIVTTITQTDKYSDTNGCGDVFKFKITTTSGTTSGDVTYIFENSQDSTLTFVNTISQTANFAYNQFKTNISIPASFFNGGNLTYTGFNNCGPITGGTLQLPTQQDIVFDAPKILSVNSSTNACLLGYVVKMFRVNVTNPVQVSVEETANPGVIATDVNNLPILPQSFNLTHLNSVSMGGAVPLPIELKFDVDYTITLVDACGNTFQKTIIQESVPFEPTVSCSSSIWTGDSYFFDDITFLNLDELPISSMAIPPLTVTFNSGPTTYSTQSGTGALTTSSVITYPFSTVVNTPNIPSPLTVDALKSFPPGIYNFTVTDACGKTSTFDYNASCSRSLDISHTLDYCGEITEDVTVYLNVPLVFSGTTAAVYKSDGTLVMSGTIGFGAPFNFIAIWGGFQISFSLPNDETYYFRYGGVISHNNPIEPVQFGGVNGIPRLVDGYLYEYEFNVDLSPFYFASIEACDTNVTMEATGGKAPYTYTLYDATGTTQLLPYQTSNVFTGLTPGQTYTAKTLDACGREFTQLFYVYEAPNPIVLEIIQPTCETLEGSVTFTNLPANWSITELTSGQTFTGSTPSFVHSNLLAGLYNYSFTDTDTNCANQIAIPIELIANNNCPIASDDIVLCSFGENSIINVTDNDVLGSLINPVSVRLIAPSNATNILFCSTGEVIGFTLLNEGTWSVNLLNGLVTFTPDVSFNSVPNAVSYTVKDFNNNLSSALIYFDCLPVAVDDTVFYNPGTSTTIEIINNDVLGDIVDPQTVAFELPTLTTGLFTSSSLQVTGEGEWLVDSITGLVTFTPEVGFLGNPTPIYYTVKDFEGNNSNEALITLTSQCELEVTCPNFETTTVQCYDEIPTNSTLTISEFEQLGDGSGIIEESACGVLLINAENSENTGCNSTVTRTYTISVYIDNNLNGYKDVTENTILNSVTCSEIFYINDTTAPVFLSTLPSDIVVECHSVPIAETLQAQDNCGVATVTFQEETLLGSCDNSYVIKRTWTATDSCGNTKNHIQNITVQDTTPPVFTVTIPSEITIENSTEIPAYTINAIDNCGSVTVNYDEEITKGKCPGNYEIMRYWIATDSCGNEAIITQLVTVIDTIPPVFNETLQEVVYVDCSNIPAIPQLSATDNDGEVLLTFEETREEGDCVSISKIIRKWTAEDACGNSTTFTQVLILACEIKIYNALTPNNDGKNDVFYLEGIECYPNNTVEIFNRYGAKIFSVRGYDNVSNVFAGKSSSDWSSSGNVLDTGTYFYIINYDYFVKDLGENRNIQKVGYLYINNN